MITYSTAAKSSEKLMKEGADNEMENKLKVLLVEPLKRPRMIEIPHEVEAMQRLVGGYIETVYPFDDPVVLVCNDEGKLDGLPLNRVLFGENGRIYDIIAGSFFIAHVPPDAEDFQSLPDDLAKKYAMKFATPERFVRVNGDIFAVPFTPRNDAPER